jgi:hypothetical protein
MRRLAARLAAARRGADARPSPAEAARETPRDKPAARAATVRRIGSPAAGIALALPVIRDLGLWRGLSAEALRALLGALAAEPVDAPDPLLDALAPHDPAAPAAFPALPEGALDRLDGAEAAAVGAADGAEAWARLVAARFAERLPGLRGSSLGYLQGQFLRRPGAAELGAERVAVSLRPVPLAIVLTMAGAVGARGPIPWLGGRALAIALEEG